VGRLRVVGICGSSGAIVSRRIQSVNTLCEKFSQLPRWCHLWAGTFRAEPEPVASNKKGLQEGGRELLAQWKPLQLVLLCGFLLCFLLGRHSDFLLEIFSLDLDPVPCSNFRRRTRHWFQSLRRVALRVNKNFAFLQSPWWPAARESPSDDDTASHSTEGMRASASRELERARNSHPRQRPQAQHYFAGEICSVRLTCLRVSKALNVLAGLRTPSYSA